MELEAEAAQHDVRLRCGVLEAQLELGVLAREQVDHAEGAGDLGRLVVRGDVARDRRDDQVDRRARILADALEAEDLVAAVGARAAQVGLREG